MSDSPLGAVLEAIEALDLEGALRLFAPTGSFMTTLGNEVTGFEQVRDELRAFFGGLRSVDYDVEVEWHTEPAVWIAEATATYVLSDYGQRGPYKRALVLRHGEAGIESLRIYGAHEPPLNALSERYQEVRGPRGWLPTL